MTMMIKISTSYLVNESSNPKSLKYDVRDQQLHFLYFISYNSVTHFLNLQKHNWNKDGLYFWNKRFIGNFLICPIMIDNIIVTVPLLTLYSTLSILLRNITHSFREPNIYMLYMFAFDLTAVIISYYDYSN